MTQEVLKLALEKIATVYATDYEYQAWAREALAETQYWNEKYKLIVQEVQEHPPQRTWVGLTDEEKSELWEISRAALPRYATYASLVEAKLKKKNT